MKRKADKPVAMAAPLPPEAYDSLPTAQLTFTAETLWLTRFDEQGKALATYPVKVSEAAAAFRGQSGAGLSTGLLPDSVLFYHQAHAKPARIGLWLPPARYTITWANGKRETRLRVPLPGLVFVGQGAEFWVWAAANRPAAEKDVLYQAPLPNINSQGLICHGNVEFPKASPATIAAGASAFLDSHFNGDLSEGRVKEQGGPLLAFLLSLAGKRAFPIGRLRPAGITLGQAMRSEHGREVWAEEEPEGEFDDEADNPAGMFYEGEAAALQDDEEPDPEFA